MSNKRRITGARRKWREKQSRRRWKKNGYKMLAMRLMGRDALVELRDNPKSTPAHRKLAYQVIGQLDKEEHAAKFKEFNDVVATIPKHNRID